MQDLDRHCAYIIFEMGVKGSASCKVVTAAFTVPTRGDDGTATVLPLQAMLSCPVLPRRA